MFTTVDTIDSNWKLLTQSGINAYMALLILAGLYRSKNESIVPAVCGMQSLVRQFFRPPCHSKNSVCCHEWFTLTTGIKDQVVVNKTTVIGEVWDKWVEHLPLIYSPNPNVTVDECLVTFSGHYPFKQYMPSKPSKCVMPGKCRSILGNLWTVFLKRTKGSMWFWRWPQVSTDTT